MDRINRDLTTSDEQVFANMGEVELTQLDQLQLALVGGGIADVIGV